MTQTFEQYNIQPWLTPVRTVSTSNVSGTYVNGPLNNGVAATLTISASSLTVDSVVMAVGDRLLLAGQTNANENGIYVVNSIASTVVLQRAADMQCAEQLKAGFSVTVGAGTVYNGSAFAIVEPLPAQFGISNMVWAQPGLTASAPLTVLGNIAAGASGTAGTLSSFPSAATSGKLVLAAVTNSSGNFNTTISNAAAVGQSQVVSIPDSGATTANFLLSKSAGTQHVTSGALGVDAGALISGLAAGGFVGKVQLFPTTGSKGSLTWQATANSGDTATVFTNAALGQATTFTVPDPGADAATMIVGQSSLPTNQVTFTVVKTATAADLATAGKVNLVVHPSATAQFAVVDIKVLKSTGLSGGGGDRLLAVSDGTIVFNNAGITAALLGTPILTVWGGSGNPLAVGASEVSTAGADIFLQYTGGTTDFTTGSVQVAVTFVQVTA